MMTPVDQFSAVADPTRCRVIEMLNERAMPVHELTAAFSISRPAISRHLRVLKEAGLVKEFKQGRENVYSLQRAMLVPMTQWLSRQSVDAADVPKAKAAVRRPKPAVQAVVKPAALPKAPRKPTSPKAEAVRVAPKQVPKPASKALPKATAAPQMQLDLF